MKFNEIKTRWKLKREKNYEKLPNLLFYTGPYATKVTIQMKNEMLYCLACCYV